jgi:hypothetical protein
VENNKVKRIQAEVLEITYEEGGSQEGPFAVLLYG